MTWPRHYLLVFGGAFWSQEIWQCGIRMRWPGTLSPEPSDSDMIAYAAGGLADVSADVAAYWADTHVGASRKAILNWVKFNAINSEGNYLDSENSNEHVLTTPVTPPAFSPLGTETIPQAALCLGMTTAAKRGPASKGRIFLPPQQYVYQSGSPRIDTTALGQILTAFHTFIAALNNWPGTDVPHDPVVSVLSPVGSGHSKPVTGVRVGDLYDTQRRRRNRLTESYTVQTV